MTRKKGLGKGLGALIPEGSIDESLIEEKNYIEEVLIENIYPREDQPRKDFEQEALDQLADSIKTYGVIQPILLQKKDDVYEIIAGERRYRAGKAAGLEKIPAIIRDLDAQELSMVSLIENIQREDLNPVEEANAYQALMTQYKMTQLEVSKRVGKSRSAVANALRLLNLDDRSLDCLKKAEITSSQGRVLLSIDDINERHKSLDGLLNKTTTVAAIEKKGSKRRTPQKPVDIYVQEAEEKLREAMGTKVVLSPAKKGGTIAISYYSNDDLERIMGKLTGEE